ncbi:MAG: LacI family DNA-binding transcriptional regulator [Victivallaceae bacterium]|nr:LacI family DNA-binding transcriptional regulator [Victivallaceae bacterium]
MKRKTTLNDIANLAGVNPSTVSRALNKAHSAMISDKQQQKILDIANRLNYRPNCSARSFASQKNFKIGLILGSIENDLSSPPFAIFIRELCGYLQQHEYLLLLLWASGQEQDIENNILDFLMSNSADGYILGSSLISPRVIAALKKMRVPVVTLYSTPSELPEQFTIAETELEQAYSAALQSIPDKFGTDILFIGASGSRTDTKLSNLISASEKHHCRYVIDTLLYQPEARNFMMDRSYARDMAKKNLQKILHYKIIFCASDLTVLGIIDAIQSSGAKVKVNRDIFIVGYDNIENFFDKKIIPAFSTIDSNMDILGRKTAALILEQLTNNDSKPKNLSVPAAFILKNEECKCYVQMTPQTNNDNDHEKIKSMALELHENLYDVII